MDRNYTGEILHGKVNAQVELPENYKIYLVVDSFLVVRRPMQKDVQMTVKIVETNKTFSTGEYIRIYVQIPWNLDN